ncbi:uncharacterized protein BX663DRAFT_429263 [Cokeromyces recurvatus]|uniref:uncharacterized protein n=1 Tax=Cokeromyces recurvatus TaxID=90255 RepID=UPI00221F1A89|nr:uncharacterized protein BX663DRAFT_429263 [Cokeromyces recurvatus]KAI7905728.1 hypothetical protein BX663DRAFT_429263 [Cokeromyces recurvatus]
MHLLVGLSNTHRSISLRSISQRYLSAPIKINTRAYVRPHYYNLTEQKSFLQNNPIKRFINNTDPNKVLWTVIGTNVGVFLLWQYSFSSYKQFGDANWLNFMVKNFVNSSEAIHNGRYHTLLTSCISHKSLDHLGINMFVLYSIGQGVIEAIGASRFLLLYAGAGLASSIISIGFKKYIRPLLSDKNDKQIITKGSMGASGSIMGITTFFACAFPKTTFLVFFIVPMPAIAVVGLFAAYDIYKEMTLNVS